jgi:hypothetical protein
MSRSAHVFICSIGAILTTTALCQAQSAPAENLALNKKACDFVTKADAESILGVAVEPREHDAFQCSFVSVGFTNKAPNNKQVRVKAWFWSSPQPKAFTEAKQGLAQFLRVGTATDIQGFADAALWFWTPGVPGGTLYAYKGGTVGVEITVSGLPEDVALRQAKVLASKPLGGTTPTGYAYLGTTKGDADANAKASSAAAAEAAALAKLLDQGKSFSQAPYITESQFMKVVKQVSLTFETDPSLEKFISSADQRKAIESELGRYGIAPNPNAPIRLVATVAHRGFVLTKSSTRAGTDTYPIHDIALTLKFVVKGGVWRNGKFYLMEAAPVSESYRIDVEEKSEFQKQVLGDDNAKTMRGAYYQIVIDALKDLASHTSAEKKPWFINSWTAQQKAAADAEFVKVMSAQSALNKKVLVGFDGMPRLDLQLTTNNDHDRTGGDRCAANRAALTELWKKSFQRVGFVEKREESTLELRHVYDCHFTYGLTPTHYFIIFDNILVFDDTAAFELNGRWVHRPAVLLMKYNTTRKIEQDFVPPMQDYLPPSVTDFLLDLVGNR